MVARYIVTAPRMPFPVQTELFPDNLHIPQLLHAIITEPGAEDIHRARILIKKLRARVRLLEGCLGAKDVYTMLEADLRRFNKGLSQQRDAAVAQQTLARLVKKKSPQRIRTVVEEMQTYLATRTSEEQRSDHTVVQQVEKIRLAIKQLGTIELDAGKVTEYLQGQLEACCAAGDEALECRKCKRLHQWRRQVKTLSYQLQVLQPTGDQAAKRMKRLDKLGKHLGLVHDYCFIQDMIVTLGDEHELQNDIDPLVKLLDKNRDKQIKKSAKLQRDICRTGLLRIQ